MTAFDVVVVAENVPYLAWQAMLFHHSCVSVLGHAPIVAVHGGTEELLDGFRRIARGGGRLQRLPTTRGRFGIDYPALNTISALEHVESDAERLVLCDPDMVLRRPPPFAELELEDDQLTFDEVPYLRVTPRTRRDLARPCERAGVSLGQLAAFGARGGVPHVVPRALRKPLAAEWLACTACFVEPGATERAFPWEALMWALVLAAVRLGLRPVRTTWSASNLHGGLRLGPGLDPHLVHYCYGDEVFDKRSYGTAAAAAAVWSARAEPGTIHGFVCDALRATARRFGLAAPAGPIGPPGAARERLSPRRDRRIVASVHLPTPTRGEIMPAANAKSSPPPPPKPSPPLPPSPPGDRG